MIAECLLSEFLATIGFRVFAYIPFLEHLRIHKRLLPLWLLLIQTVSLSAFGLMLSFGVPYAMANLVVLPISIVFFFSAIKMERGKTAFVYMFTMAYLLFGRGAAGVIVRLLPGMPGEGSWQYGLAALCVFAITLPVMLHYILKAAQMVFETNAPSVWRTIWLLPMLTIALVMLFTYGREETLLILFARLLLMLCILLVHYYLLSSVRGFQKQMEAEEKIRHLEQTSAMLGSQYAQLQNHMEQTRRARHDLRQHLTAIQGCIDSGDMSALSSYVKAYGASLPGETIRTYCKNYAVDAVLRYYAECAESLEVQMEVSFRMEQNPIIPEPALCVLLGNLLENALDACALMTGERFVRVKALQTGDSMLSITVDNSCAQEPIWKEGRLLSTKHDGVGTGTDSVRVIAEQYDGDAQFEYKDGIFYASVMLNP